MAIYRTDRDRRILGDRVVARKAVFEEVHPAVGEVHGVFSETHGKMAEALEERQREENEGTMAREGREQAAGDGRGAGHCVSIEGRSGVTLGTMACRAYR